jgi:hypothetical protein
MRQTGRWPQAGLHMQGTFRMTEKTGTFSQRTNVQSVFALENWLNHFKRPFKMNRNVNLHTMG